MKFYRCQHLLPHEKQCVESKFAKVWKYIYRNPDKEKIIIDNDIFCMGKNKAGLISLVGLKNTIYLNNPNELDDMDYKDKEIVVVIYTMHLEDNIEIDYKQNVEYKKHSATAIIIKIPYCLRNDINMIAHMSVFDFMNEHPDLEL
jgi:hypothetical protein